jgi:hypothetical protein
MGGIKYEVFLYILSNDSLQYFCGSNDKYGRYENTAVKTGLLNP